MLRHTTLTFPAHVVKRIAHFVDITCEHEFTRRTRWEERCQCLRHLCLVSRAYRECTAPFLYRAIRLDLRTPQCLLRLISTLDRSTTASLLSLQEPSGYGSCTQFIFLNIAQNAMRQSDLAIGIRNLTDRLPRLRLAHIHAYPGFEPVAELSSLNTLTLELVDLAILFDHIPALRTLESFQRLSIIGCYDDGFSSRSLRESPPRLYLPNLLEISFREDSYGIGTFVTLSTWTMPHLRSLHFREPEIFANSLLLEFFKFLETHGPQLHHLTWACTYLRQQDLSSTIALCSGLRSLDIVGSVSFSELPASHTHLEKIRVNLGRDQLSMNRSQENAQVSSFMKLFDRDTWENTALRTLQSLKPKIEMSFPKLLEAEIALDIVDGIKLQSTKASFRTEDTFITFCDGSKTYRLFDGQADIVGAYFGQAVILPTSLPWINYPFL
jgi:hypothetical protein